jgi:hypothetical protein
MRMRLLAGMGAAALLGGCVPQLQLAAGPNGCGGLLQRSAYPRTSIMATTQRVQALQSRFSLTSRSAARSSAAGWTAAASGECR